MAQPILVIMAAGIGSRFGGLKQMAPFGAAGEGLVHYSLYDAYQAGFQRVLFVVNRHIHDDFRAFLGSGAPSQLDIRYVFQELDRLPEGFSLPAGREKPWGTAHAVLCCEDALDAPFCVVNGDDLYGRDAYRRMHAQLAQDPAPGTYAMVGYPLIDTLSQDGSVSRGQCFVDEAGTLSHIIERTHVIPTVDGALYTLDGQTYIRIPDGTLASMNMWGFTPDFVRELRDRFPAFLREALLKDPLKAEYYLPSVVGELLLEKKASVRVLATTARWIGVTHPKDREGAAAALAEWTRRGHYPKHLWPTSGADAESPCEGVSSAAP